MNIELQINGNPFSVDVEKNTTLLQVVRDLGLTGTKFSCGTGDCGACKVLIDGEAVNSCVTPAHRCVGKSIITIEGLGTSRNPHPIQQAFVDSHAVQCGFCTPGMVISSKALLDKNPNPDRQQIIKALEKNLCRCTGYEKIIDAVQLAAERLKKHE